MLYFSFTVQSNKQNVCSLSSPFVATCFLSLQEYLVQYGYMDPEVMVNVSMMTESMMKTCLTDFQTFVGLEPTGNCTLAVL
jgi:hypothetical protein